MLLCSMNIILFIGFFYFRFKLDRNSSKFPVESKPEAEREGGFPRTPADCRGKCNPTYIVVLCYNIFMTIYFYQLNI